MNDIELQSLLRSALPATPGEALDRDLWPQVVDRIGSRPEPRWVDITLAAGIVTLLALFPEWLFVLAYHL